MQTSGAMDAMGIESRDEFRCGTQHDGICFPGSRRNLHRKLCCSDLSVSVAYLIWKGNKFSLCTGGNRKKICFPDLSSSSGSIRPSEKMFRRSGSQQLSDLFLAATGFGIYADSGDSFWHICGLCVCKGAVTPVTLSSEIAGIITVHIMENVI